MICVRSISVVLVLIVLVVAPFPLRGQQACAAPWTLEETLRIGSISGPVVFQDVRALDLDTDGRVYIAQGMVPQVSIFTSEGQPAGALGRAGRGPGEFSLGVFDLGWRADTLWITDATSLRLFDRNRTELARFPFLQGMAQGRLLADGSILEWVTGLSLNREFTPYLRRSRAGARLGTILQEPARIRTVVLPLGSGTFTANVLLSSLGPRVTRDGTGILWLGQVRTQRPATFELLRIGLSGDTILRRAVPYEPRPISRSEAERFRDEKVEHIQSGSSTYPIGLLRRAVEEGMPIPDHHPPVREIVPGHDGTIWLLREPRPDSVDVWEVYDPLGRLEGRVHVTGRPLVFRVSPRMRLLHVTRAEVWAMTRGEWDEPYVHRFRVVNPCR